MNKMFKQFSEPCQLIHRKDPTPKNDSRIHESEVASQCIQCAWIGAGLLVDGCMDSMQNGLQRYISA